VKGLISHSKTAQAFASTGASIAAGWEGSARKQAPPEGAQQR
jgi:membrane protein required for colicin V production